MVIFKLWLTFLTKNSKFNCSLEQRKTLPYLNDNFCSTLIWSKNGLQTVLLRSVRFFSSRYAYPKPFIAKFPCKILQRLVIEWSIRIWVFCEVNNWLKQRYHSPGPMRTLNIKLLLDTRLGNSTQLISSTNQFIPKIPDNFNFFPTPSL